MTISSEFVKALIKELETTDLEPQWAPLNTDYYVDGTRPVLYLGGNHSSCEYDPEKLLEALYKTVRDPTIEFWTTAHDGIVGDIIGLIGIEVDDDDYGFAVIYVASVTGRLYVIHRIGTPDREIYTLSSLGLIGVLPKKGHIRSGFTAAALGKVSDIQTDPIERVSLYEALYGEDANEVVHRSN